jgi:magnesium transporter
MVYEHKTLRWGSLSESFSDHKLLFIDAVKPTEQDLERISEQTNINLDEIHEAIDPDERPRIHDGKNYSLIILRVPHHISHKGIITTPYVFFFSGHFVVCIRHYDSGFISDIHELNDPRLIKHFEGGVSKLLYWLVDESVGHFFKYMDHIEDQINLIEARVYKHVQETILKQIFSLKKVLIYFHKALTANREVINSLQKESITVFAQQENGYLQNTYNDVTQLLDLVTTYRDLLTGSMDMYLTTVSNNMNSVIKKITAMGSFVLIPTLISGIYGMNFQFMPELYWKYGYLFALGTMTLSVILLYLYFRRKGWLQ